MKCNVTRQSATWLQQADLISALCETRVWLQAKQPWLQAKYTMVVWNALLTTPYVSEHYKYMFLVARDLDEMFVLYRGKHTTRRSTVGIWSEVRAYRTPPTNIPWAGVLRLGKFPDNRRQTRTQWHQAICTSVLPASETPVNQKIYHLNTLHLCPVKTNKDSKTNKERVTEFFNQAVELSTSDCSIFTENEGLVQIKSLQPITTLVLITNCTSPNYTDRPQVNIHCIENFFTAHDFWATCACPEKNRVALKFFTLLNILFTFRSFEQLALALKHRGCPEFIVLNIYFLLFRIFEHLALALKKRVALNFHGRAFPFDNQGFWTTCACPEKQRVPWIHSDE